MKDSLTMAGSRIRLAFLALAAATLVACGGGGAGGDAAAPLAGTAPAVQTVPLKVEAFVQPAGSQDLPTVKARALFSPAPQAAKLALGPLSQSKASAQGGEGGARLVGAARALDGAATADALAAQLRWTSTPTGARVAAISVSAEGAHGLRLGLHIMALPGSAAVRVYSQQHPNTVYEVSGQQILQTIERNLAAGDDAETAHTWWTPELGDAEQTVEFELPAGTDPRAMQVSIPRVSHIFEDLSLPQEEAITTKINESSPCNLDATCYEELAQQRNAVARMLYTKSGSTFACTGTLLNDAGSTQTPYFLSANHCISTQSVASTVQTDWFYRSPSCNARTLSPLSTRKFGGATLLYASTNTDTALMRLDQVPPAGATFAGWDATVVGAPVAVAGLHHPRADLLKASFGQIISQVDCQPISDTQFSCRAASGNYYRVQWARGTTEGGSSGSALFRNGYVVGTLYGGAVTCTASESSDYYGRFDVAYGAGLKQWLGVAPSPTAARVPVFRFFNAKTGAHFYTASADERDFVSRTYADFRYENVAFYAYATPTANQSAVFRFFNQQTGAHFYTINARERDFVQSTYPAFKYEGPSWYAQPAPGGTSTAMYRFFNTRTGAHFYTISAGERDFVIANYPDFRFESTAYYAWTTQ